jgi:N6-adenosine-specific RNA methylase IME4
MDKLDAYAHFWMLGEKHLAEQMKNEVSIFEGGAPLPEKYELAKTYLREVDEIDPVLAMEDKAAALATYAKLSSDEELEFYARRIRLHARRRSGELLAQISAQGTRSDKLLQGDQKKLTKEQAAESAGMSKHQKDTALQFAKVPEEEFEAMVEAPVPSTDEEILQAAKEIRAQKNKAKRKERIEKIIEISGANGDLPTDVRYPVIYADPPWQYDYTPTEARAIENQYPTMTLQEICDLPVTELAADDAILYLWTTAPKLYESMKVLDAWGFDYRTCMIWDKQKMGMGYYARNQHEILLIAKRGSFPAPESGSQPRSVISIPRGKHSEKPVEFYEIIESLYPDFARIELFSRSPREGWEGWGNQYDS